MINELVLIFSAIVTYVLGKVSKKFKWNDNLPIPMQNLLVGILVFVVVVLYQKATGAIVNIQETVQQIYYALGGSGLATLLYDAKKSTKEYR